MILVDLFIEFFKVGLFSIGGGLATIPFLMELTQKYDWFSKKELLNMIAISESTPGAIGINISTYAGYHAAGILGALVATFSLVLPSFIIIIIIARLLNKFHDNIYVERTLSGIRPASSGLILGAVYSVIVLTFFNLDAYKLSSNIMDLINLKSLIFFAFIGLLIKTKKDLHPSLIILLGAVFGIILKL